MTDLPPTPDQNQQQGPADTTFDPLLSAPPKVNDYSKVHVPAGEEVSFTPEPTFDTASLTLDNETDDDEKKPAGPASASGPSQGPSNENATFNKEYSDLGEKDKRQGAEMAVDTALGAYTMLCEKGLGALTKINKQKIEQYIASGELDPSLPIPINDQGETVGIREYVEVFNEAVGENFKVSQDFIDEVRPVMIRIFKKKGLAMTDEQFVAFAFIKDLGVKTAILFSLKSSTRQIANSLMEQTRQMADARRPSAQPFSQHQPQQQETAAPEETFATDFSFDLTPKPDGFVPAEQVSGMPEFGNEELLKHMEESARTTGSARSAGSKNERKRPTGGANSNQSKGPEKNQKPAEKA